MRSRLPLILALVAALLGLWFFLDLASLASRSGDDSPLYSARRLDPHGAAALVDLLRERGQSVRIVRRPRLEPADRGTLIQILPLSAAAPALATPAAPTPPAPATSPAAPTSPAPELPSAVAGLRVEELAQWIADGNTVVQFTRAYTPLMRHFRLPTHGGAHEAGAQSLPVRAEEHERAGKPPADSPGVVATPQWTTAGLDLLAPRSAPPALELVEPMTLAHAASGAWRPLAIWNGRAAVGEYRFGAGRLIVVGAPTPATNDGLTRAGNLDLLLQIVGDKPVLIDEWSHGLGHAGTILGVVVALGLFPALLQVGVVLGLYHWSTRGWRRPDPADPPRRRSSLEQVETLGHLYGQSLQPQAACALVRREVLGRLAAALRCREPLVADHLQALRPELAERGRALLADLDRLTASTPNPACLNCGFDLTGNTSGRCPECGTTIPLRTLQRIAIRPASAMPARAPAPASARGLESLMAHLLTRSSELSTEISRDRTTRR